MKSKKPILVIGDIHFPAACFESIDRMFQITETMSFGYVIQLGDLYDQYSMSRFPKNPNYFTPKEETEISRTQGEKFWQTVKEQWPKAKCFQLVGNHGKPRITKKCLASAPELFHLLDIDSLWEFKGVETIKDYEEHLELEGINFIHGFLGRVGGHVDYFLEDVVNCHTHRSHIVHRVKKNKVITEFNVGYLANPFHPCLSYTPMKKISRWTKGFGIIDHLGPRFISL